MYIVTAYLLYLIVSVALTVWVAQTLHKNGLIFLVDSFLGNRELANSVNHLLVVGFYLINLGYVLMALATPVRPTSVQAVIELLSTKLGVVMLVLGAMHFTNIVIFSKMRKRAMLRYEPPPVAPQQFVRPPAA
ncbi:putative integral membrane protein [Candidatus Koribacter versatilis Ellin345]|uniref:Integral membrane protein n=1 Tax=Koribacter versatilis (strain Ellin345) TaxID=204669 RepID=Q1IVC3_KORVE|nr:hypothetical protein [Candidatus Koribacter versatilis]ABF39177.1 putative integral membrane protein [Candidatus Koribacter versatilis Ellin345]